ncbi:MAG: DNA translocase FtsK [Raineya sp.]|jgi:S-DNA-T family DNA segregation ATPase FtsK/SpoIIIE|nr:DNA translocase FtsK [Raineya sp.]
MIENTYIQNKPISTEKKKKKKLVFKPLQDRRVQLIIGFFFIFLSIYLFTAFTSYLFTAQADQSIVEAFHETGTREAGEEVENWLGIYGAVLSYYFIFRWFGIGSFLLVTLLFLYGFKMVFRVHLLPTGKVWGLGIFAVLWLSTLLGYLASNLPENTWLHSITGVTGFEIALTVKALLGWGTILLLIFCLLAFVIYFFNVTTIKNNKKVEAPTEDESITAPKEAENVKRKPLKNETNKFQETEANEIDIDEAKISTDILQDKDKIDDELEKMGIKLISKKDKVEKNITQEPIVEERRDEENLDALDEDNLLDEKTWETPVNLKDVAKEEPLELEVKERRVEAKDTSKNKEISLEIENITPIPTNVVVPDVEIENVEEDEDLDEEDIKTGFSTNYDPTLDLSRYVYPTIELLREPTNNTVQVTKEELEANKDKIVETLGHYGIGIGSIKATIGPTVTLYEIVPDAGVRISKIKNLEDDIALSLAALGIRIIAPIPGKGTIGIEVPNQKRELVAMRTLIAHEKFKNSTMDLPVVFGKTVTNEIFVIDLAKMPHLLMAGATGQGKSVGLNVILTSLLYKKHPSQLKFVLVDPKKVELTLFNKIEKHFLAKLPNEEEAIITDTSKVINTLNSLCIEMDSRYSLLKDAACRNIKEYNQKFTDRKLNPKNGHKFLPYIVLVIDELADLMMTAGKEVEQPIARLAQLARAIGIHLVVATQRPSVNVITGIIKANFPSRLSFRVTSKIDSRTILDTGGAEQLIGMGDMLYSAGSDLTRLQCAFIDTPEVENLCDFIADQQGYASAYMLPEYVGESAESNSEDFDFSDRDALFEEAARIIVMHQQGSTSLLQRRLKLGYNRAGRLIDQLEKAGIVGAFEGSKAREVLVADEIELEKLLKSLDK